MFSASTLVHWKVPKDPFKSWTPRTLQSKSPHTPISTIWLPAVLFSWCPMELGVTMLSFSLNVSVMLLPLAWSDPISLHLCICVCLCMYAYCPCPPVSSLWATAVFLSPGYVQNHLAALTKHQWCLGPNSDHLNQNLGERRPEIDVKKKIIHISVTWSVVPGTAVSITQKLVRSANSQTPIQIHWFRVGDVGGGEGEALGPRLSLWVTLFHSPSIVGT